MNNNKIISNEYFSDNATTSDPKEISIPQDRIDISKYELNKPRRIFMKAKIIK